MKNKLKASISEARSIAETHRHAVNLASVLSKKCHLILLVGELGAGKSEWARGFIKSLIGNAAPVTSPTYSFINIYEKKSIRIFHVDLYRLVSAEDLESLGFWDLLAGTNLVLVEWGDMLPRDWPKNISVTRVLIEKQKAQLRKISVSLL